MTAHHADPERIASALFVDDEELRQRLNPKLGRDRFAAILKAIEEKSPDFPRIHRLWGGRYWPKLKAWLDNDCGVANHELTLTDSAEDGPETFDDAPARQDTRAQDRPHAARRHPVDLLDRPSGGARHQGLSGSVHPFAGRAKR